MVKGQMILIYSDNAIFITIAEKTPLMPYLKQLIIYFKSAPYFERVN